MYHTSPSLSYAYDALNRLTNMTDAAGSTRYAYNDAGQLLSEDGPWASNTVSYAYDHRLRVSLGLQEPNGPAWAENYAYDSLKRLTNVTSAAGAFGYAYGSGQSGSPANLVRRLVLPNGAAITNAFDSVARLTGTYLRQWGQTIYFGFMLDL